MILTQSGDFANVASKKLSLINPTNGSFFTMNIDLTSYSGQTVFQIGRDFKDAGGTQRPIIYLDNIRVEQGDTFKLRNLVGTGDSTYVRQISGNGSALMRGFTYNNPADGSYTRYGTLYQVNAGAGVYIAPSWALGTTNDFAFMDAHIFFIGKMGSTNPTLDIYIQKGTALNQANLIRKGLVLQEGQHITLRKLVFKRDEQLIVRCEGGYVVIVYSGFSFPNKT